MPRTRSANSANAARWREALRRRALVAVRAGQGVIEAGMRQRCSPKPAGLLASIHSRKPGAGPDFVGGFVVADHPLATRAERARPFVGPTSRADGAKAVEAMMKKLLQA